MIHIGLPLTVEEYEAIEAIRRAGGFASEEDALRGALFWYAGFLNLRPAPHLFAIGRRPRRRSASPEET